MRSDQIRQRASKNFEEKFNPVRQNTEESIGSPLLVVEKFPLLKKIRYWLRALRDTQQTVGHQSGLKKKTIQSCGQTADGTILVDSSSDEESSTSADDEQWKQLQNNSYI